MLTLPATRRAELMERLLALPPQQRGGGAAASTPGGASPASGGGVSSGASEALTMLEADGVYRLSATEVRELLASIHDDS